MSLGSVRGSPRFDVVAMGASAGGIHALSAVISMLAHPFPVPVTFVLHLSPAHTSALVQVLSRTTGRAIDWARDAEQMRPGGVYAAPPDRHLEFDARGRMQLVSTPPVHFTRPAVDQLFAAAARVFGARALAVVLSGNGHDGASGALAVRRAGGVVVAQNKATSEYFAMANAALDCGAVTYLAPLDAIASTITSLVRSGDPGPDVETPESPEPPTDEPPAIDRVPRSPQR